jgi:hypothetical protein
MKYEKYWFHVLGLSIPQKQVKSEKKVRLSRWVAGFFGRNLYRQYLSRLKCYRYEIFDNLHHLSWIDAPHTQF